MLITSTKKFNINLNNVDYLQTVDSRAEFDLRRFGTVPRFDQKTLEENHHGQNNEENQKQPLTLTDSGDILAPQAIDPNRT